MSWVFVFVFVLILSCMSCLYNLEIKPLLVASFADIFSCFVGCLFILLMVSFAMRKILSLVRSRLFIFSKHRFDAKPLDLFKCVDALKHFPQFYIELLELPLCACVSVKIHII